MTDPQARRIIEHYRTELTQHTERYGTRLPSVRKTAEEFGVAPNTALKAMRALQAEGLIEAIDREGYRVAYRVHDLATLRVPVAGTRVRGELYGDDDKLEIIAAGVSRTDPDVADRMGLAVAVPPQAIRRQGLVRRDGRIIRMATSWFPAELAERVPELLLKESTAPGSVTRIEAATGRPTWLTVDEFGVDLTGPLHLSAFGFPEGSPALVRTTVRFDGVQVVEYGTSWFPRNINLRYEYAEPEA